MTYEIVIEDVAARPLAAVRRRVRAGHVASAWRPALDEVWAFLRAHDGVWNHGDNIFVYHSAKPGEPMDVEFGVEVTGAFEGEGEVVFTHTPAGQVVSTLHVGPYEGLSDAYAAIAAWREAHGCAFAGHSWEIYGDWTDDPAKLEVRVVYLLA